MNPVSTWSGTMVALEGGILDFSTPKSSENAFQDLYLLKISFKIL